MSRAVEGGRTDREFRADVRRRMAIGSGLLVASTTAVLYSQIRGWTAGTSSFGLAAAVLAIQLCNEYRLLTRLKRRNGIASRAGLEGRTENPTRWERLYSDE